MYKGFLSPGTKQTVRNNEMSVLSGFPDWSGVWLYNEYKEPRYNKTSLWRAYVASPFGLRSAVRYINIPM